MGAMQCFHCDRKVFGTIHKPKSYLVDYYRMHTGHTESDYLVNPRQDAPPLHYLRLTQAIDIYTCIDCYARSDIRQRLDDDITGRRALLSGRGELEDCAQLNSKG